MDKNPHPLTDAEWAQIVRVPQVREAWGLPGDADPLEFASTVYGAKFNFFSGGPGYIGDIYILQGDALTEVSPMVLKRDQAGQLVVC